MTITDADTRQTFAALAIAPAGAGSEAAAGREALARGLPGLNRALGARVSPGGDRLATHVPLAAVFTHDAAGVAWGLLKAPSDVVRALIAIEAHVAGVRLRLGIGAGGLDGRPGPDVTALAGPCLRAAAGALEAAAPKRRWARVAGFGEAGDRVLNGVLAVVGAVRGEWTAKQARTVRLARRHETRRAVAKELGVSPSVVTESLTAAHFDLLLEAEEALTTLFALYDPPGA